MTSILADHQIIDVRDITRVDTSRLMSDHIVTVYTREGSWTASDFHAIEVVMAMKPSAMEGKRFRWSKGTIWFHNIVGHPVMQIMAWAGYGHAAIRFHDWTTPRPIGFRK